MSNSSSSNKTVRSRFAPSPTGLMHLGGLRNGLYSYLFAKHGKGASILRIEDTDRERFVPGATEHIISVMEEFGIAPDEGPTVTNGKLSSKGEYGPYIQSERLDIYKQAADELLKKGMAYHCFCTKQELDQMRAQQIAKKLAPRYDRRCRYVSPEDRKKKLASGMPSVIRLKLPEAGQIVFTDAVRGKVSFSYENVDDQVLMKSDGFPTYHLANVVDDHAMKITHVIRSEEWISSTPKHIFLYQAFGWEKDMPVFAHLPLIVNTDRKKLSKRDGDMSVKTFVDNGYLKEALLNFVAFLGWNPKTTQELFTLPELIKGFSLEKVNKAAAIFDISRLDWMNAQYIKQMRMSDFISYAIPFFKKNGKDISNLDRTIQERIVNLEQPRIHHFSEVGEETSFFFVFDSAYDPALLVWKKSTPEDTTAYLGQAKQLLAAISDDEFTKEHIEEQCFSHIKSTGLKNGDFLWPLRIAVTGKKQSPSPFESAALIGKTQVIERIDIALKKLAGA